MIQGRDVGRRNDYWSNPRRKRTRRFRRRGRFITGLIFCVGLVYLSDTLPDLARGLAGTARPAAQVVAVASLRVIDGDTINREGQRYRLVGFDTPETFRAQCAYEKALGDTATARLNDLITSGQAVDLAVLPGRDKYGRGLARLYVGGRDVGEILITEGLARAYSGGRRESWC